MDILEMPRSVKPLLVGYAIIRTGHGRIPGRYDSSMNVWVIDSADGARPIIDTGLTVGDTSTTTRAKAEQDDTDVSPMFLASTTTFTKVNAEGNDTDVSASPLAEVSTKTQAQLESDDHPFTLDLTNPQAWSDGRTISRPLR